MPAWMIMLVDAAFLPWLAYAIGKPIWKRKQWHQLPFPAILLTLSFANALMYFSLWQGIDLLDIASKLAVYTLLALLVLMGGRIIPFFTEKGCNLRFKPTHRIVTQGALIAFAVVALLDITNTLTPIMALAAFIASTLFWTQLVYWQSWRTGSNPLVWILHLGYAGIGLGFMLKGASAIWTELAPLAVHAWMMMTMGGIGLGMMTRVSLGHSGRTLTTLPGMRWAFLMIIAAGITRLAALWLPMALVLSIVLWCFALGFFFWRYLPVWLQTRLDGRPD